jgi:hypothetical protein
LTADFAVYKHLLQVEACVSEELSIGGCSAFVLEVLRGGPGVEENTKSSTLPVVAGHPTIHLGYDLNVWEDQMLIHLLTLFRFSETNWLQI